MNVKGTELRVGLYIALLSGYKSVELGLH